MSGKQREIERLEEKRKFLTELYKDTPRNPTARSRQQIRRENIEGAKAMTSLQKEQSRSVKGGEFKSWRENLSDLKGI